MRITVFLLLFSSLSGCRLFESSNGGPIGGNDVADVSNDRGTEPDLARDRSQNDMVVEDTSDATPDRDSDNRPENWFDLRYPHRERLSFVRDVYGPLSTGIVADVFFDPDSFPAGISRDLSTIVFTDAEGTVLPHDAETPTNGRYHFFVKVPAPAAQVELFAYWGFSDPQRFPMPRETWSEYVLVMHADNAIPNDRSGTISVFNVIDTTQTIEDGRQVFQFANGGLTSAESEQFLLSPGTEIMTHVRFKPNAETGSFGHLVHMRNDCVGLDITGSPTVGARMFHGTSCAMSDTETRNVGSKLGQWSDLVAIVAVNAEQNLGIRLYDNGALSVEESFPPINNTVPVGALVTIGSNKGLSEFFDGFIDEVRITRTSFTPDRIAAEFASAQGTLFDRDAIEAIVPNM